MTLTMGLDLGKPVACICTNAVRRTDPIGKTAERYVFIRALMRALIRFWIHEGQKKKQTEGKREIYCIPKRRASPAKVKKNIQYKRHKLQIRHRNYKMEYGKGKKERKIYRTLARNF